MTRKGKQVPSSGPASELAEGRPKEDEMGAPAVAAMWKSGEPTDVASLLPPSGSWGQIQVVRPAANTFIGSKS